MLDFINHKKYIYQTSILEWNMPDIIKIIVQTEMENMGLTTYPQYALTHPVP